jgi:hypothetical protein
VLVNGRMILKIYIKDWAIDLNASCYSVARIPRDLRVGVSTAAGVITDGSDLSTMHRRDSRPGRLFVSATLPMIHEYGIQRRVLHVEEIQRFFCLYSLELFN